MNYIYPEICPFDYELIYPMTIYNNCLYYVDIKERSIFFMSLLADHLKLNLFNLEIKNITKDNCKHICWQNNVFILISAPSLQPNTYIIKLYSYSLLNHKKNCLHIITSNLDLHEIYFVPFNKYLLLIGKRTFSVTYGILLSFLLMTTNETHNLYVEFETQNKYLTEPTSRPIPVVLSHCYLGVLDGNEPSSLWKLYLIQEHSSQNNDIFVTLKDQSNRKCKPLHILSCSLLNRVPIPVPFNETTKNTSKSMTKLWSHLNMLNVPATISEGTIEVNNGYQLLCLGFSRLHGKSQLFRCDVMNLIGLSNKHTYVPFQAIGCDIVFDSHNIYSLLCSADSENIYLLEWVPDLKCFKRFLSSLYEFDKSDVKENKQYFHLTKVFHQQNKKCLNKKIKAQNE